MIKRIVKMNLHSSREAEFLHIFEGVKKEIRAQPGCLCLEVLRRDHLGDLSLWTISVWESEDALNQYRSSELFKHTWAGVKALFASPAEAWTLTPIETLA
jgi:quinol monooxygenase YgiN